LQNKYIKAGTMNWEVLQEFWTDAGQFETLFLAGSYWAKKKGVKV